MSSIVQQVSYPRQSLMKDDDQFARILLKTLFNEISLCVVSFTAVVGRPGTSTTASASWSPEMASVITQAARWRPRVPRRTSGPLKPDCRLRGFKTLWAARPPSLGISRHPSYPYNHF